jgi:hypothetical protein
MTDFREIIKYWEANILTVGHKNSTPFTEPEGS